MEMNYDDAELHRIEEELHMEILPGTEVCCLSLTTVRKFLLTQ